MVLTKLAFSNFFSRKIRVALTVAAIALSVSLVVSVTSGYASVEAAVHRYLAQYMGTTDVVITKQNSRGGTTSDKILAELRKDPDVAKADGRYEVQLVITAPGQSKPTPKSVTVIGLRRPEDTNSEFLRVVSGNWFDTSRGNVVVIDQAVAEALQLHVGSEVALPVKPSAVPPVPAPEESTDASDASTQPTTKPAAPTGPRLKVVGIIHKPAVVAAMLPAMYVPLETIQEFVGGQGQIARIDVDLKPGADAEAFAVRWQPRLVAIDPNLKSRTARETRRQMDKNLLGIHVLSYLGGTVSMLAATFIVFSALSMGVSERQRTLAMLRAVGAQRGQVARLVLIDGLALAIAGVAVGVPLGWAWIQILAAMYDDVFTAGVAVSWGGILMGSVGSIATALAASLLPAWSASRVSPLEAMSPLAVPAGSGLPWVSALFGLLLIGVDPFLFFGPLDRIVGALGAADVQNTTRELQFFGHFGAGLPCLMIGFFLLAPIFVWTVERVLGPVVAPMFGLRYAMLRQQLTTGVWRVAGTCAALMVGLSVLIVMQTNGQSMLRGWRLPDRFPDIFVSTSPLQGLSWKEQEQLASVPGIRPNEIMPIGIASPQFVDNPFGGASSLASVGLAALMPDATMFIAVPPDKAFKMMELDFREGNPDDAARMLAMGDHIVVTEEFRNLKGLGVGKTLELKTNKGVRKFTIAGVVWSPGIDVMVAMHDMNRQFEQRTAASVFGSLEDGRKYFGIKEVFMFAANLDAGVEREEILKRVKKQLGERGMRAGDVRHIKYGIQQGFYRLLMLISTVAFAAMAVASLGVTNTIMASIRSRRWQFGILRSIGVTRSQLLRLVMAEAFLIAIVGSALGVAAGLLMSVDANRHSAVVTGFKPPLYIPWSIVWLGVGIVTAVSLLASLWPAVSVARDEPLSLLQAGRASA